MKYYYEDGTESFELITGKTLRFDNDLPSLEKDDGNCKIWMKTDFNGNLYYHRDNDLPAYDCPNFKAWRKDGRRHRLTGPALIEYGDNYYYINGNCFSEDEFNEIVSRMGIYYTLKANFDYLYICADKNRFILSQEYIYERIKFKTAKYAIEFNELLNHKVIGEKMILVCQDRENNLIWEKPI